MHEKSNRILNFAFAFTYSNFLTFQKQTTYTKIDFKQYFRKLFFKLDPMLKIIMFSTLRNLRSTKIRRCGMIVNMATLQQTGIDVEL